MLAVRLMIEVSGINAGTGAVHARDAEMAVSDNGRREYNMKLAPSSSEQRKLNTWWGLASVHFVQNHEKQLGFILIGLDN